MQINTEHRLDQAVWRPSAHWDLRPSGLLPELVVVHCVSLPEGQYGTGAPQRLFTGVLDCAEHSSFADLEGLKVAPHVLIDRLGQLEQFVGLINELGMRGHLLGAAAIAAMISALA